MRNGGEGKGEWLWRGKERWLKVRGTGSEKLQGRELEVYGVGSGSKGVVSRSKGVVSGSKGGGSWSQEARSGS